MTHASADLDDRTVAYVVDAQRPFDDLRQAIAQVSGWLVLAALHARDSVADHPALVGAEALVRDSIEDVREMRTPVRARRHHDCLLRAARLLDSAVRAARAGRHLRTDADIQRVSKAVQEAYAYLARAAAALPGFELLSFDHACCNHKSKINNQQCP